jgi:uroporphyrinogen-III synthase
VPATTHRAAGGDTPAAALTAAGYQVDLVPPEDNSAKGLLRELAQFEQYGPALRVLTLRSDIAKPVLTEGLIARGHSVEQVVAYRTIGVRVDESIVEDVAAGNVQAILITSGSVAEQVRLQFTSLPDSVLIAAIGPQTARDAEGYGLRVDVIARERSATSLVDAIAEVAQTRKALK